MAKQSTKISPGEKIQLPSQEQFQGSTKRLALQIEEKVKKQDRDTGEINISNLEDKSEERTPNAK